MHSRIAKVRGTIGLTVSQVKYMKYIVNRCFFEGAYRTSLIRVLGTGSKSKKRCKLYFFCIDPILYKSIWKATSVARVLERKFPFSTHRLCDARSIGNTFTESAHDECWAMSRENSNPKQDNHYEHYQNQQKQPKQLVISSSIASCRESPRPLLIPCFL